MILYLAWYWMSNEYLDVQQFESLHGLLDAGFLSIDPIASGRTLRIHDDPELDSKQVGDETELVPYHRLSNDNMQN